MSPGFLGLLWNARMLSENTHLGPIAFAVTFGIAEMAFLLAIVCAVVLHSKFTGTAMMCSLGALTLQALQSTIERVKTLGHAHEGEGNNVKNLFEGFEKIKAELASDFSFPWYVRVAARVHGYLTVAGYVCVAIVILAFKFH